MPSPVRKVSLTDAFTSFDEPWSPRIAAAVNGQHVKLAKLDGAFIWHAHPDADELFLVIAGRLVLELRDSADALEPIELGPGEFAVVPRGVEHRPIADTGTEVLLFEPAGTRNTGDAGGTRTVDEPMWLET